MAVYQPTQSSRNCTGLHAAPGARGAGKAGGWESPLGMGHRWEGTMVGWGPGCRAELLQGQHLRDMRGLTPCPSSAGMGTEDCPAEGSPGPWPDVVTHVLRTHRRMCARGTGVGADRPSAAWRPLPSLQPGQLLARAGPVCLGGQWSVVVREALSFPGPCPVTGHTHTVSLVLFVPSFVPNVPPGPGWAPQTHVLTTRSAPGRQRPESSQVTPPAADRPREPRAFKGRLHHPRSATKRLRREL